LNKDAVTSEFQPLLSRACEALRGTLESLEPEERQELEIYIQGHTDSTQPPHAMDARARYLYNWNLSGRRASSVLYEFVECGVSPSKYRILAMGYADTNPLPGCREDTEECNHRNRRTTFRVHTDTRRMFERLIKER
jgi:flagellar motor protein MotB